MLGGVNNNRQLRVWNVATQALIVSMKTQTDNYIINYCCNIRLVYIFTHVMLICVYVN